MIDKKFITKLYKATREGLKKIEEEKKELTSSDVLLCINKLREIVKETKEKKKKSQWLSKSYFYYRRKLKNLLVAIKVLDELFLGKIMSNMVNIALPKLNT